MIDVRESAKPPLPGRKKKRYDPVVDGYAVTSHRSRFLQVTIFCNSSKNIEPIKIIGNGRKRPF